MSAAARPAAGRFKRAEVRPFREIGFAEDDRTAGAQIGRDRGILLGGLADERERTGAGLHLVAGVDVVLKQDRNAMERTEHPALPAQPVGVSSHVQRIGVQFDDRIDSFVLLIERGDACNVFLGQVYRGEPARRHLRLELGNGRFVVPRRNFVLVVVGSDRER